MADRVIESFAKGLVGFLLLNPVTGVRFFRVYKSTGGFVDYGIRAEDIKMMIVSDVISRYDCEGGESYLDWSSAYLHH